MNKIERYNLDKLVKIELNLTFSTFDEAKLYADDITSRGNWVS